MTASIFETVAGVLPILNVNSTLEQVTNSHQAMDLVSAIFPIERSFNVAFPRCRQKTLSSRTAFGQLFIVSEKDGRTRLDSIPDMVYSGGRSKLTSLLQPVLSQTSPTVVARSTSLRKDDS